MQIYVCDDEPQILNRISSKISSYMPDDVVVSFSSGGELMEAMKKEPCDILFLDIDMPGINGMEAAHRISDMGQKPLLIFVTSHDELVYESLQYHPFGFIRKSFFAQEIEKVLEDCRRELDSGKKHFQFQLSGRKIILLLADILYFEADGNYLKIRTRTGQYRFRSTVTAVENALAGSGFVRVHKGFLVNLSAVGMIRREELKLVNDETIPLGKSYADAAKKRLLQYMRL